MSKHIFKGVATILIVTLLMMFAVGPVLAFDARKGNGEPRHVRQLQLSGKR